MGRQAGPGEPRKLRLYLSVVFPDGQSACLRLVFEEAVGLSLLYQKGAMGPCQMLHTEGYSSSSDPNFILLAFIHFVASFFFFLDRRLKMF